MDRFPVLDSAGILGENDPNRSFYLCRAVPNSNRRAADRLERSFLGRSADLFPARVARSRQAPTQGMGKYELEEGKLAVPAMRRGE